MSNRVQFWLGAEDGLASHFLTGPLDRFEAWISNEVVALRRELESILAIVRDARQQGVNALRADNALRAEQVDRTLDLFYGEFCDRSEPDLLVRADPSMHPERYYREAEVWLAHSGASEATMELWEWLLAGRPVLRDVRALPYQSADGVFRLGYWSSAECDALARELLPLAARAPRDEIPQALVSSLVAISQAQTGRVGLITSVA